MFYDASIASINNVLLLDTDKIPDGRQMFHNCRWVVYDESATRFFGEWRGHKSRKAAIADLLRRSANRPKSHNNKIKGTVVEKALLN